MMKKYITPLVVFIAVFLETLLLQHYTTILREWHSLFLWTPDYISKTFSSPLPVSHFIGNFLTQFCYFPVIGALIIALLSSLCCLLLCLAVRRAWKDVPIIGAIISMVAWAITAKNASMHFLALTLICSLVIYIICLAAFKKGKKENPSNIMIIAACAIAVVGAGYICIDKGAKSTERIARVEYDARMHKWDDLLKTATPKACRKDAQFLPYVTLALAESGQLPDKLRSYPYTCAEDMNLEDATTSRRYLASSLCYECLGCTNEALHNMFQFASDYPYGMNFLALRKLIYLNIDAGKPDLVKKYCAVLSKSTLHKGYIKKALAKMPEALPKETKNTSWEDKMMTKSEEYNMRFMPTSRSACDRMLCAMILSGDTNGFKALFARVQDMFYKDNVPELYRKTLSERTL